MKEKYFSPKEFHTPNPFGACSVEQIEALESQFSIKVPDDYREYLLTFNGAEPINTVCSLDEYDGTYVHHMYGLYDADYPMVSVENNMLFFADDTFGSQFAINLDNTCNYGIVYFIDGETEEITVISQSFNEFIRSLISKDQDMENLRLEHPDIYERIQEFKRNPQI